jgi:hypothetical protein
MFFVSAQTLGFAQIVKFVFLGLGIKICVNLPLENIRSGARQPRLAGGVD